MELERAYRLAQRFADADFEGTIDVAAGQPPYAGASLTFAVSANVERLTKLLELLNDKKLLEDADVQLWIADDKLRVALK